MFCILGCGSKRIGFASCQLDTSGIKTNRIFPVVVFILAARSVSRKADQLKVKQALFND